MEDSLFLQDQYRSQLLIERHGLRVDIHLKLLDGDARASLQGLVQRGEGVVHAFARTIAGVLLADENDPGDLRARHGLLDRSVSGCRLWRSGPLLFA